MNNLIVHQLSYCIPDENIFDFYNIKDKKHIVIYDIIQEENLTYRFGADQEKEYNEHYQLYIKLIKYIFNYIIICLIIYLIIYLII